MLDLFPIGEVCERIFSEFALLRIADYVTVRPCHTAGQLRLRNRTGKVGPSRAGFALGIACCDPRR